MSNGAHNADWLYARADELLGARGIRQVDTLIVAAAERAAPPMHTLDTLWNPKMSTAVNASHQIASNATPVPLSAAKRAQKQQQSQATAAAAAAATAAAAASQRATHSDAPCSQDEKAINLDAIPPPSSPMFSQFSQSQYLNFSQSTGTFIDDLERNGGGGGGSGNVRASSRKRARRRSRRQSRRNALKAQQNQWKDVSASISLGCETLDAMVAVRAGDTVELCGASNSGKTQLCFAAAASSALAGARVLFLDTAANFSAERVADLLIERVGWQMEDEAASAAAPAASASTATSPRTPSHAAAAPPPTGQLAALHDAQRRGARALQRIRVRRACTRAQLYAALDELAKRATEAAGDGAPPNTDRDDNSRAQQSLLGDAQPALVCAQPTLVIIDSLGPCVFHAFSVDPSDAVPSTAQLARAMKRLALRGDCCVVYTNNLIRDGHQALGEAWSYVPTHRLFVERALVGGAFARRVTVQDSVRSAVRQQALLDVRIMAASVATAESATQEAMLADDYED